MNKGKIREFWDKHKLDIAAFATVAGVAVCGVVVGYLARDYRLCKELGGKLVIEDPDFNTLMKDVLTTYPDHAGYLFGKANTPIASDALGKLGELAVACTGKEDSTFTHFIAIGPSITND